MSNFTDSKKKRSAPGEDRTHDLQIAQHIELWIMRLTRCLLRYRGLWIFSLQTSGTFKKDSLSHLKSLNQCFLGLLGGNTFSILGMMEEKTKN